MKSGVNCCLALLALWVASVGTACAQGELINGGNHEGATSPAGEEDTWTFVASINDTIILRCGELTGTSSYNPFLRLVGPTGVLVASGNGATDSFISVRATNNGTFSVLVSSSVAGQTGTYNLRFLRIPGTIVVPAGDEGGPLGNGGNHVGTNSLGDEDAWTFSAAVGDNLTVRCGEIAGTASYSPYVRLYGPTGVLIGADNDASDSYINHRATNNGVFTAVVGSWFPGHAGSYSLRCALVPGAFTVPDGDEGGALTNGANHIGITANGDEDMWTFNAITGDDLTVRCGEIAGTASYTPFVRLIGPTGIQISFDNDASDSYINHRATNSGTFTVIVGAWFRGQTGTYSLRLVKAPGTFVVLSDDEGGPLANGGNHAGVTSNGDEDMWSFTAAVGDNITLRVGEVTGSGSYYPYLRLIGPTGVLIGADNDAIDSYLNYRATNAGDYTVVVGSWFAGHTGSYSLRYVNVPGAFVVPPGDEGGALTNGANHLGVTDNGDEDVWSFAAIIGDNITVRCGEVTGTSAYYPYVRLIGPTGIQIAFDNDSSDSFINHRATNNGTFTVIVGAWFRGQTGTYNLRFMRVPGTYIVPDGDEGGVLANGGNHTGTNSIGDEDIWSFTAEAGDEIILRCGEVAGTASYFPFLRLIGPTGVQIAVDNDAGDSYVSHHATNSGTYTVLVGSWHAGHTGSYRLRYLKMPGSFIVPAGDEGGSLTGNNHEGTIDNGDEDIWRFTICRGERIALRCLELSGTASFHPWMRLYGPTGTFIAFDNHPTNSIINHTATNSGTYTVVVGSWFAGHTGTYRLIHNDLTFDLKNCMPSVLVTNVILSAVGGTPDRAFVAFTSTDIAAPLSQWVPFLTNQFNRLGVYTHTNRFDRSEPKRFYTTREE